LGLVTTIIGGEVCVATRLHVNSHRAETQQSAFIVESGHIVGKLLYSSTAMEIGFEDRALAHLQLVIGVKLRRGENLFFSWKNKINVGSGRSSIWIEPSIPLYFKFSGSQHPVINRAWVELLTESAYSSAGLIYHAEPGTEPTPHSLPQNRV
jgi:hypothetical protein